MPRRSLCPPVWSLPSARRPRQVSAGLPSGSPGRYAACRRGRRTRRRPTAARYALDDGDREFVIGSNAGDHRDGFALNALHPYRRVAVVALLPALAPAPEA